MSKPKILIVEDEWIIANDLKTSLKDLGYGISSVVATGEDAIKTVGTNKPDLILMDIVLQGEMDGVEAARKIVSIFDIPVIYLTAYTDKAILEQAKRSGAYGYLLKPFQDRELQAAIEMSLYKHRTEKKLKASENQLYTTLKSINDAVISTDSKGIITFMNTHAQDLTGWKFEKVKRKHLQDVLDIRGRQKDQKDDNSVISIIQEGMTVTQAEYTIYSKNGSKKSIELSSAPITDEHGNINGTVLVFRDITKRIQTEKELDTYRIQLEQIAEERTAKLRLFSDIVQKSPDGVQIVDPDGRIIYSNKAVEEIYGFSHQELTGAQFSEINADPGLAIREILPAIRKRGRWDGELLVRHKSGRIFPIWLAAFIVHDNNKQPMGMIGIIRDLTERKKAEEQIKIANEELLAINRIIRASTSITDIKEMLETVLDRVIEIVGLEGAIVCLLESDDTLRLVAHRAASEMTVKDLTENKIKVGECLCGNCARDLKPLVLPDRKSVLEYSSGEATRREDIRFHAAYPFVSGDKCVGVLCIFTKTVMKPLERSLKLLETVTAQIALAVENARLYEDTLQHAVTLEKNVRERTAELLKANESLQQEINVRQKAEKKLLDHRKQLQSLTSQMSLIEENEKRRIAAELHDCIGQTLALSKIKLGLLNKSAPSAELKKIIKEILHLIEQTIKETRTLTFELSPPILYELGLSQAIKWLIDQFREKHGLNVTFTDDGKDKPFDNNTRFFLFQAIRELLVNVVKHAHAKSAKIIMSRDGGKLNIIIEDDGVGFSERNTSYDGYGLFNIRERMNHINGHFDIKSIPGRGTRVTLVAPLILDKKYVKKELI